MIDVLEEVAKLGAKFEGLHDLQDDGLIYPYHDQAGYPTQGYGTLLSREKWADLSQWKPKTIEECTQDLMDEMKTKMDYALQYSPNLVEDYNKWRLVAITDFIYNLGQGAYKDSTLRKRINAEQWDLAVYEIKRWNMAGGKVLKGLDNRRKAEAELLLKEV